MRAAVSFVSIPVLILGCLACDDATSKYADETAATPTTEETTDGTSNTTDTDTDVPADPSPIVSSLDARCTEHTTGEATYIWTITADATDPQGADTLETFVQDAIQVEANGSVVATYALSCVVEDLSIAHCSGSFLEVEDNIICTNAASYSISVTAVDQDGNTGTNTTQGRMQ